MQTTTKLSICCLILYFKSSREVNTFVLWIIDFNIMFSDKSSVLLCLIADMWNINEVEAKWQLMRVGYWRRVHAGWNTYIYVVVIKYDEYHEVKLE